MSFEKINENTYRNREMKYTRHTREDLANIVRLIKNYPNVTIEALMYELCGNSHDESWIKIYDAFNPTTWNDFLIKEESKENTLYVESPFVKYHDDSIDAFDLEEWARYHEDREGESSYREVFISSNGVAKKLTIFSTYVDEKNSCIAVSIENE